VCIDVLNMIMSSVLRSCDSNTLPHLFKDSFNALLISVLHILRWGISLCGLVALSHNYTLIINLSRSNYKSQHQGSAG
jgi:hypothetical protein